MSRRLLTLVAALLLLGAAFSPTTSLAQEDEEDEANETEEPGDEADESEEREDEDEEDEREDKRSVEVSTEGKDVSIELERETEPREDKVEMKWKADEATFELEHETENETREIENKLEAVFGALAEYRDGNDNGRYDPGEEIVSGWTLGEEFEDEDDLALDNKAEWGQPSVEDVNRSGKQGKQITSTAQLGDQGQLGLRLLVFGDFVELNETSLSPTGAKIDILVDDYAFQANDTDLALFLETETENEFESDIEDDDETGVSATDPANQTGTELVFTWKNSAQVDGESRPVETTVLEQEAETESDEEESSTEEERSFVLSYPRGEQIVHDPRAEVLLQSGATADAPAPGALAALGVLAGLALVARRRA